MRQLIIVLILSSLSGCVSKPVLAPRGTVSHVVVVWLKHPGDAGLRKMLIDRSKEFLQIPGVQRIAVGSALPSNRAMVDSTYDVALVITFKDEAALRAYDDHAIHKQAVKEVLEPLAGRIVIYDVTNE